ARSGRHTLLSRAARPLGAGRAHAAGAAGGVARGRVSHQALPRLAGRAPLHPRSARPAAISAPGAVRRRIARQRGRLDPRRCGRGERGRRAGQPVARGGASLGPTDGARPRADRPRGGGPPPARRGTGVSAAPLRAVTFGELMLRLSPPGQERLFQSPQLRTGFGGCEANVAVGLAHLGVRADYITRLPDSPIGQAALHALQAEGVGTGWIALAGGGDRMGIYFVEPGADIRASRVVYDRAGSAFAAITPAMVDWAKALGGAAWFHGSGITPALGDGPRAALSAAITAARSSKARISVDLNYP